MNGPDHYREAERLIGVAQDFPGDSIGNDAQGLAEIHAILALTAATALRIQHEFYEIAEDVEQWAQATGAAVVTDSREG